MGALQMQRAQMSYKQKLLLNQNISFSSSQAFSSEMGTRTCIPQKHAFVGPRRIKILGRNEFALAEIVAKLRF